MNRDSVPGEGKDRVKRGQNNDNGRKGGQKPDQDQGPGGAGKSDEMEGFRPGPGNTGSMDGRDETGRRQVNHKI